MGADTQSVEDNSPGELFQDEMRVPREGEEELQILQEEEDEIRVPQETFYTTRSGRAVKPPQRLGF